MMDIQPNRPQDITPGRPRGATPPHSRPRPMMDDFGPRRPTPHMIPPRPGQTPAQATPPAQPAPQPAPVHHQPQPHRRAPARPAHLMSDFGSAPARPYVHQPRPQPRPNDMPAPPQPEETPVTEPRHRNTTGHAGLVGLTVFVLLAALLLSPLIHGKIMKLPASSSSSSSGDQTIACAHDVANTSTTTAYSTKLGAPLIYKYASTTTMKGTCDGKPQTVVGGRTAEFSPLAAAVDVALALAFAIVISIIWRKIFGHKS